ncbi:MAG: metal ABC transporter permease [Verrucomicrobiota bacterium]
MLGLLFVTAPLTAAGVNDLAGGGDGFWSQAARFASLSDPSVRYALAGALLLGLGCGLLGGFIVVRKMALVGDALSHAVLPGVAAGFLWAGTKDPVAIFIGATIAGLLGTATVTAITSTTRLKEDTALGLVLTSYFALGICMLTMIQRLPNGNQSGIGTFLFGQAAALGPDDIQLMGIVTAAAVVVIVAGYKELLVTSFDPGFARSAGLPVALIHHTLMFLLAAAVVVALQAVGVVLVSAMLITPAAAAYLLTDRLHRLLLLAAAFGVLSGVVGAFGSFVGQGLPTGPLMVLAASTVFAGAFLFGPRHGVVARWWRQRSERGRTRRENALKAMFHLWEEDNFGPEGVALADFAQRRRCTLEEIGAIVRELARHDLVTLDREMVYFTPAGRLRAGEIVRNHRLWELYLTESANIAPDHVHEDAERIEHVLGEATVRALERRLNYAKTDPHGKLIPSPRELHRIEHDALERPAGGGGTSVGGGREGGQS